MRLRLPSNLLASSLLPSNLWHEIGRSGSEGDRGVTRGALKDRVTYGACGISRQTIGDNGVSVCLSRIESF